MTDQKKKRVFSAVLSGLIMLLVVIVSIICYQLVGILERRKQIQILNEQIAVITEEIEDVKDEIESWGCDWRKELALREQGIFGNVDE